MNLKSVVSRRQAWLLSLSVLILANSAYLFAFTDASLFYVGNVFAHVGLGVAAICAWVFWLQRMPGSRPGFVLFRWTAVLVTAGSGILLVVLGNLKPQRPLLIAHIVAGLIACLLILAGLRTLGRKWVLPAGVGLILAAAVLPVGKRWIGIPEADYVSNPSLPPADMAGEAMGGATGPFFPSAAETASGDLIPSDFFLESEACGRSGCHPDVTEQWQSSAHRFSSFNNQWYRKSIEYMQDVVGLEAPKWCAGCHDHALLFPGTMGRPVSDFIDEPEAHAGLGCVSCHNIVEIKNTAGNAGFVIEYPRLHDLANSPNRLVRWLHDTSLRLDPEPHRRTFLKPFHREQSAEFCSTCHKVHLDVPVNNYRWLRGFNTYDNWQASGVSGMGARSFYEPEQPATCVTCHMPEVSSEDAGHGDGLVHSHRFVAANTALPVAYRDSLQLQRTIDFLRANQLRVDIFAVTEPDSTGKGAVDSVGTRQGLAASTTFAVGEERGIEPGSGGLVRTPSRILAPLSDGLVALRPGSSVRLDVVVRTLGVGHFFPTGTVDAQEAWLEVRAEDTQGRVIFWSGNLDDNGNVEPGAHFYRSLMVDGRSSAINKRNAWATRATVYANLIPPGAADVAHYRLEIPDDIVGEVRISARLHYRKFISWHTRFAYEGIVADSTANASVGYDHDERTWTFSDRPLDVSGPMKETPELPIVTMATDSVVLTVGSSFARPGPEGGSLERERWNDYGIGLLLEGDLREAERAFKNVVQLDSSYADGWVNLARVYVQEGSLDDAAEALAGAERARPGFHKTAYFLGLYHKALGEYAEALDHLRAVSGKYPRDRVILNQIGRILYLDSRAEEAIPVFERVLEIDSEDLMAHYNLALCHRATGSPGRAKEHEIRYLRFKEDESSQAVARAYRQANPHDNNESQAIHEHQSSLERKDVRVEDESRIYQ